MEKESSLGKLDKAMAISKAYMNSSFFERFKHASDMDHVTTLSNYVRKDPEVDMDSKDDDKLLKYYVITVEDTEGISADGKIDIILDSTGHDVAIRYVDCNSNQMTLDVSPKILENNAELIKKLELGINKSPEEVAKMLAPKDLKGLVRDLERHGSIAMASKEDAKERADEHDEREIDDKNKIKAEDNSPERDEDARRKEEIEAEAKDNTDIPEENLSEVVRICMENNLNPKNLKQSLRFEDPTILIDDMDNQKTRINPNAGSVLVLRFRDSGVEGKDKVIMAQKGETLPYDGSNDQRISEMMEKHKGNNITVAHDYDDGHEDDIADRVDETINEMREDMEESAKQIRAMGGEESVKLAYIKSQNSKIQAEYEDKIFDMVSDEFPCREALKQADALRENTQEIKEDENDKAEEVVTNTPENDLDDDIYDEVGRRRRFPRH